MSTTRVLPAGDDPAAEMRLVPPHVACLAPFVRAGVFAAAEVHLAATLARLSPALSDEVVLGLAIAARGPRLGHVCVVLDDVRSQVHGDLDERAHDLPWPEPSTWAAALAASPLVASPADHLVEPVRPLVWDGRRLYLQRYWHYEVQVADELRARAAEGADTLPAGSTAALDAALDTFFAPELPVPRDEPADPDAAAAVEPDLQRRAAQVALSHGLAVIVGGPGTGKTRTVARLLAAAQLVAGQQGRPLKVALAAPTGKAAARMTEAVRLAVDELEADPLLDLPADLAELLRATTATTVHGLLGSLPGTRFRHDRQHPLPHDLVVVDETSMVALPLMAHLLAAVRPDARLVLVGDPYQLASVEAGTVLSDVVGPAAELPSARSSGSSGSADTADLADTPGPAAVAGTDAGTTGPLAGHVAVLRRARRFGADSAIAALADAVRAGDADTALAVLDGPRTDAVWVRDSDAAGLAELERVVVDAGVEVAMAALAGLASSGLDAASRVKVLAATRHRRLGLHDWSERIEAAVAARVPELQRTRRWYVGRPVMVTANDKLNRIANGDVGLVVAQGDGIAVAFAAGEDDVRLLPPSRLDRVETWWAMTIHKSQGSEFAHAIVSLPPADSPLLTRELLYTAVTRARERVTVVGDETALRGAIERPITRASGLRDRLWTPQGVADS
jgi:exodeoxyribonuclease V alpha subunit